MSAFALGIDPGVSNPGLALLERVGPRWGIVRLPVLHSLDDLAAELTCIRDAGHRIATVVVEDVSFSLHSKDPNIKRGGGSGRIVEAVGMARLFAKMQDAALMELAPTTWRKRACGNGRATKAQVRTFLKHRVDGWPPGVVGLNRSDAIALAISGGAIQRSLLG